MAENVSKYMHTAGAYLKYSATGNPGSYTEIDDLVEYDPPGRQRGRVPASTLRTPQKIMRKKPGWINPGEARFKIVATAAKTATLDGYFLSGQTLYWIEGLPQEYGSGASPGASGGTFRYRAWIGDFKAGQARTRDQDELVESELTLVIEGLGQVDGDAANFFDSGTGTS